MHRLVQALIAGSSFVVASAFRVDETWTPYRARHRSETSQRMALNGRGEGSAALKSAGSVARLEFTSRGCFVAENQHVTGSDLL